MLRSRRLLKFVFLMPLGISVMVRMFNCRQLSFTPMYVGLTGKCLEKCSYWQ